MAQKLYTEEQVREILKSTHIHTDNDVDMILPQFTPIELPSDEEIEERYYQELEHRREVAKNFKGQVAGRHPDMFGSSEIHHMVRGYLECAKWIKEQILKQNK